MVAATVGRQLTAHRTCAERSRTCAYSVLAATGRSQNWCGHTTWSCPAVHPRMVSSLSSSSYRWLSSSRAGSAGGMSSPREEAAAPSSAASAVQTLTALVRTVAPFSTIASGTSLVMGASASACGGDAAASSSRPPVPGSRSLSVALSRGVCAGLGDAASSTRGRFNGGIKVTTGRPFPTRLGALPSPPAPLPLIAAARRLAPDTDAI